MRNRKKKQNNYKIYERRKMIIRIIIPCIIIAPILFYFLLTGGNEPLEGIFEVFFALVAAALLEWIIDIIISKKEQKNEEKSRLSFDYKELIKKYPCEHMYENRGIKFPIVDCNVSNSKEGFEIKIFDNPDTYYELPDIIKEKYDELISTYKYSNTYNTICVRLKNLIINGNTLSIKTERTYYYYYYSLVTNRAIDFCLKNGTTVREYLEPGPVISELTNSKLSNHMGFDCILVSKDNSVVFVKRDYENTIAKGKVTLGCSASLKYKNLISNRNDDLRDIEKFFGTIKKEIEDEIGLAKIEENDISIGESINIWKNTKPKLVATYRKIQEGGKPQMMFFVELPFTDDEIKAFFMDKKKKRDKKWNSERAKMDGGGILFCKLDDCLKQINDLAENENALIINNKRYNTTPETLAMICMYKEWQMKAK